MIKTLRQTLPQQAAAKAFGMVTVFLLAQVLVSLSAVQTTAAEDTPITLSQPVLDVPADNSWSKSSSVDFRWNPVDGATKYEFRYGKNITCATNPDDSDPTHTGQFAGDETTIETTDPSKTLETLSDGKWCWQVRAVKNVILGADIYSDWSPIWSVKVDKVAPVVTLDKTSVSPNFKGTVDDKDAIMVAFIDGTAHSDIAITVATKQNDDSTYNWSLKLPDSISTGDHVLRVKATDAAGNDAVTTNQAFTIKPLTVTQSNGLDPNITQAATLPLVPTGPLVFVAPIPAPVQTNAISQDNVTPIPQASIPTEQPAEKAVLAAEVTPKLNGHTTQAPVEATGQGWALFGVTWYWWVLGGGVAALGWSLLARWRLASRLA